MNSTVTMILIKEKPLLRALWTPDLPGSPYTCGGAGWISLSSSSLSCRSLRSGLLRCDLIIPRACRRPRCLPVGEEMDGVMERRKEGGMNPFLPDAGIRGLACDLSFLPP